MAPSRGGLIAASTAKRLSIYRPLLLRGFASSAVHPSGHNRWSKIKHDKGKNDAAKNKQRSVFAKEIAIASKMFGPDPNMNNRLAEIIAKAKREGFAKTSIEAAIARGQGRSVTGTSLENVTMEGILPGNVGVIVECETDSRLRTLSGVRLALKTAGGSSSPSAFLFEKRGRITFREKEGVGVDEALEVALDAGATDVEEIEGEGRVVVFCEPGDTKAVGEAISSNLGLDVATSEIIWSPNEDTRVGLSSERAALDLSEFVDNLQEAESTVSAIAMNVAQGSLSDESWQELETRLST